MAVKELGHVVLYVKDVEVSRHFYGDVLGWHEIDQDNRRPMAVFSSGRTHHELLLIEVGPQAAPVQRGHHLGMYHFGLKVGETDEELKEVLENLVANNVKIVGASDHTVTHSLYIEDPDGNEIELYIDVQPAIWKDHPEAVVAPVKPLTL